MEPIAMADTDALGGSTPEMRGLIAVCKERHRSLNLLITILLALGTSAIGVVLKWSVDSDASIRKEAATTASRTDERMEKIEDSNIVMREQLSGIQSTLTSIDKRIK